MSVAAPSPNGVAVTPITPVTAHLGPLAPELPPNQLNGIEEFGHLRNWVSFDPQRGRFICRNLDFDTDEFLGTIVESRAVRVMKDVDGNVFCSSSDRVISDTGREGKSCAECEDKGIHCFPRWWIAWEELESGLIYAHTLSQTGTMNFNAFANGLLRQGITPGKVLTRIYVEEAERKKARTTYRRVQFERVDA